jgi:hypothetical protein
MFLIVFMFAHCISSTAERPMNIITEWILYCIEEKHICTQWLIYGLQGAIHPPNKCTYDRNYSSA